MQPILTFEKALSFKNEIENDLINTFFSHPTSSFCPDSHFLENIMEPSTEEQYVG